MFVSRFTSYLNYLSERKARAGAQQICEHREWKARTDAGKRF
jgi:hypothetical protein